MAQQKSATAMVRPFQEIPPQAMPLAGGKGAVLAQLTQAGFPVPAGFVIFPAAFESDHLRPEAWPPIAAILAALREPETRFAVRSSGLCEDSATASFAGEFETVLDLGSDDEIREAIARVRRSRHGERVAAYTRAMAEAGPSGEHELAVVVQVMVQAQHAGVLFTADPISGSHNHMVGNFVAGLGEQLVSGEACAGEFRLHQPSGRYEGPQALAPAAPELFQLAVRLERQMGRPQDIEWALSGQKIALLQSRPITTMCAGNPSTGSWNDSLRGDYLWSNANFGEAVPDVMTPVTWSIMQLYARAMLGADHRDRHPSVGNICGRLYFNLSMPISFALAEGDSLDQAKSHFREFLGRLPAEVEVPVVILPPETEAEDDEEEEDAAALVPQLDAFIMTTPERFRALKSRITALEAPHLLAELWRQELQPFLLASFTMMQAGGVLLVAETEQLRAALEDRVNDRDMNTLLAVFNKGGDQVESMGPLMGLLQVARGTMARSRYIHRFGHRGAHDFELSIPREVEDPQWIDRQLEHLGDALAETEALLARQQAEFRAAWSRFAHSHPDRSATVAELLEATGAAGRRREAVRSETGRVLWLTRIFFLRVGALCGLGDDVFHLYLDEVLALLEGQDRASAWIPARRATHAQYVAAAPYPAVISGRFNLAQWRKDPNRRLDFFDSHAEHKVIPTQDGITGFPGAPGIVEGRVRLLATPEEGDRLQAGEIIVTSTTNVGWTPLFPLAAAIVTDVGAPLSHAAIVARELGIPAVVGCGHATMRLKTGDRVRVNGAAGSVEILEEHAGP